MLDLENKEPEIQEVIKEVEVEKIIEDTTGIDNLNKDIIKLQTQIASRDQAIERISQKYDLVDRKAKEVND